MNALTLSPEMIRPLTRPITAETPSAATAPSTIVFGSPSIVVAPTRLDSAIT